MGQYDELQVNSLNVSSYPRKDLVLRKRMSEGYKADELKNLNRNDRRDLGLNLHTYD